MTHSVSLCERHKVQCMYLLCFSPPIGTKTSPSSARVASMSFMLQQNCKTKFHWRILEISLKFFMIFSWKTLDSFFDTLESSWKHLWHCLETPFELLLVTLTLPLIILKGLLERPLMFLEAPLKLPWNILETSLQHPWKFQQTPLQLTQNILLQILWMLQTNKPSFCSGSWNEIYAT